MEPKFRRVMFYYDPVENGMACMELISVVVQDAETKGILTHGSMNLEAWKKTQETKIVHFWSTHENKLRHKGATSGNEMEVIWQRLDCDRDAVLIGVKIRGDGVACHTGHKSCFHNKVL